MGRINKVESQLVIGMDALNKQVYFPKVKEFNKNSSLTHESYRSRSSKGGRERRQRRDMEQRSPTILQLHQFGTNR